MMGAQRPKKPNNLKISLPCSASKKYFSGFKSSFPSTEMQTRPTQASFTPTSRDGHKPRLALHLQVEMDINPG